MARGRRVRKGGGGFAPWGGGAGLPPRERGAVLGKTDPHPWRSIRIDIASGEQNAGAGGLLCNLLMHT